MSVTQPTEQEVAAAKAFYKEISEVEERALNAIAQHFCQDIPDDFSKLGEAGILLSDSARYRQLKIEIPLQYPDCMTYAAYHKLIGSTPRFTPHPDISKDFEYVINHDFPSPLSIKAFYEEIIADPSIMVAPTKSNGNNPSILEMRHAHG